MKVKHQGTLQGTEKEFLDLFQKLCYSRSAWEVWADLMSVMACSISNAVDRVPEQFEAREKEYEWCIKRIGSVDMAAKVLNVIVMALENNPDQDFLGAMYMKLNLGNHWKGQFFTPYNACHLMAEMIVGNGEEEIKEKGWISIGDPCIGGGAVMIAAANAFRRKNINYQNHVLFAGQDVDRVVAMMAYIQLSLLGCAGYIVVGDSLSHPMTGPILFPRESEYQEIWYMPMFHSEVWTTRRMIQTFSIISGTETTQKTVGKEQLTYFFNFEQEELA